MEIMGSRMIVAHTVWEEFMSRAAHELMIIFKDIKKVQQLSIYLKVNKQEDKLTEQFSAVWCVLHDEMIVYIKKG